MCFVSTGVIKISRNTPTPDAWGAAFDERPTPWVRVELEDGRLIFGWPEYFGDTADNMDLFIRDPVIEVPLENGGWQAHRGPYATLVTKNAQIRMVHFYRPPWKSKDASESKTLSDPESPREGGVVQ